MAEVDAAELMDDFSVRNSKVSYKLLKLKNVAEKSRNKWQDLKSYLRSAFPKSEWAIKQAEAGAVYYSAASQNNWEEITSLLKTGETFISQNNTALLANDNMPIAFFGDFTQIKKDYADALDDFYSEEEAEEDLAEDKIIANNQIYEKLMLMCSDGQKIFRLDEGKRKQFVFEHILDIVSNNLASLSGKITTSEPLQILSDFVVSIKETGEEAITNVNGVFDFGVIKANTYTLVVSKDDYQTQTILNVEVKTGTAKIVNVVMVKL
jgi:hypothetical protein